MFECCLRIIIVFCVLIPEVGPPRDPGALRPDFGSSEPLGVGHLLYSAPSHCISPIFSIYVRMYSIFIYNMEVHN